jgi:hypothetical protein
MNGFYCCSTLGFTWIFKVQKLQSFTCTDFSFSVNSAERSLQKDQQAQGFEIFIFAVFDAKLTTVTICLKVLNFTFKLAVLRQ